MKQQLMDFRHQHVDTVVTLDNLMKTRRQLHPGKQFIYVHVGELREKDVFVSQEGSARVLSVFFF